MKISLVIAFFASSIALGWIAMSHTPAMAYYPPQCINVGGESYCLSRFYTAGQCVTRKFNGTNYHYCRHAAGGGAGEGSGY
jgi:hypothetical protein